MGSRKRLAQALDTDERGLLGTLSARLNTLHPPVKISSQQAPVTLMGTTDYSAGANTPNGTPATSRNRKGVDPVAVALG